MLYSFQIWRLGLDQLQILAEQCPAAGASIQELIVVEIEEVVELSHSGLCACCWRPPKCDEPQEEDHPPAAAGASTSSGNVEPPLRSAADTFKDFEEHLRQQWQLQQAAAGLTGEELERQAECAISDMKFSDPHLAVIAFFMREDKDDLDKWPDPPGPDEVTAQLWRTLPSIKLLSIGKRGDEPAYLRAVSVEREEALVRLFQAAPRNCVGRVHYEKDVSCGQRLARLMCEGGCPWVDVIVAEEMM
jgi:hypothetical protein